MTDQPCMRWSPGGRQSWRRPEDGGFDDSLYWAGEIETCLAKPFVIETHYARSYPADKRNYGMFEIASGRLVGVAVLSVPTSPLILPAVFPGLAGNEAADLGRFVLLDEVPANAESWFLAEVRRLAAKPVKDEDGKVIRPGLRGLVMFSDPVQRRRADGTLVTPGHVGTIYQASNLLYLGMSGPSTEALLPDGTVFGNRTAQKIRAQERGHAYAERKLVALGARPMRAGEKPAAWLREALDAVGAVKFRHPGKHKYAGPWARPALRGRQ